MIKFYRHLWYWLCRKEVVDKMMKISDKAEIFSGLQDQLLILKPRKYFSLV